MFVFHFSSGERRLVGLKIGHNLKALAKDTGHTYLVEPVKNGNPVQAALGAPAGALRGVLEAGDAIFEGALDREIDFETGNRIIRDAETIAKDIRDMIGNALTFHPIKALKNAGGAGLAAFRLPQDILMEAVDQGGGYDAYRRNTRSQIEHALSA